MDERKNTLQYFDDSTDINTASSNDSFEYYDDKGKLRNIALDKYADVIYNHVSYPKYTSVDFEIHNGYSKLIDNNGDGKYDVVFLYNYTSFIPKSKSEKDENIIDKTGTVYNVSGENVYTVGGREYKMSSVYSAEKDGKFPHDLGDNVLLYLDLYGKIVNSASVDDVIKYEVENDRTGRVVKFFSDLTLDYNLPLESQMFEAPRSSSSDSGQHGVTETKFYGNDLIAFGKIVRKTTEGFIFNAHSETDYDKRWNRTIICKEGQYVNCYDIAHDECSLMTFAEVEEDDYVFVQMLKGELTSMVVYRQ